MIIHDVIQGTDEWHELRRGKFTASTFSDLFMAKSTKGYNNLISQVVFERLTGESPESFENDWMARGKELEGEAREQYELETFNKVEPVGFVEMSEWVGCSPDGFVGTEGLVQIKCPKYSTLIDYLLSGSVPKDYMIQMQGEMWVTGRKWCDFFVYHPKLKPMLKRVTPDEKILEQLKEEVNKAVVEAQTRIKKLKG